MPKLLSRATSTLPVVTVIKPESAPAATADAPGPTRRFLSLGSRQVVAVDAISFYEDVSGVLVVHLRGRQTLTARVPERNQLHGAMLELVGGETVLGKNAFSIPAVDLVPTGRSLPAGSKIRFLRFTGLYATDDVIVALESIDAYEHKGDTLHLHLVGGQTKVVQCQDLPSFQQAMEAVYGPVLEVKTQRQQEPQREFDGDPCNPMGYFNHLPRRR